MGWAHSFLRLALAVNGSLLLSVLGIVPRKAPKEIAYLPTYKTNKWSEINVYCQEPETDL